MTKPFKGIFNLDSRVSVPDWGPYEQPKAPEGAPNVLYIVWDDTGFGWSWEMYGE
jgi:arylsulfatase